MLEPADDQDVAVLRAHGVGYHVGHRDGYVAALHDFDREPDSPPALLLIAAVFLVAFLFIAVALTPMLSDAVEGPDEWTR